MIKVTNITLLFVSITLLLVCGNATAGQCNALFPDGASTHSAGGTISFGSDARLFGSDDNLLATTAISKNAGSSVKTCNTVDCVATGTPSEPASAISFQTTTSTVNVAVGYQGSVVVGSGSFPGNEFDNINPGSASEASITFSADHSEYFVDSLILGFKNTLYLKAGTTYWFNQLTLGSQANIIVDGTGSAIIYVNQSVTVLSSGLFNSPSTNNSGDASKLVMYVLSAVTFDDNTTFSGSLYVKDDLLLGSSSKVFGAVSAANIQLNADSTITYQGAEVADTSFGALCSNNVILNANYNFDELSWSGAAGDVTDSSGNGQDATSFNSLFTNDISPAIVGNPGSCRYGQFDGVDDYIQLPASFPNLTGSITITAWINAADLNSGSRIFIDDQSNSQGFGLSLSDGGAGKLRFYSRAVNPVFVDTQNAVISADNWYFVAAVHDATNKTVKLYVNGVALVLDNGSTVSTYTGTWGSDAGPASIGGETNSSSEAGANFHFNGAIDETRIYSTALTAAQISTIMSETRTCPIPPTALLEYRFEESSWNGTAGEIIDNTGNGFDAQVTNNSTPKLSSPALSGAIGTCGYANLDNGSIKTTGLPLDTSTTGVKTTVTFWMNWDGTNSVMPIGWNSHDIWLVGGSIGFNTGNSDVYGVSSAGLANGWHHIAVEFTNGSVTSNRMFIDGVEQVLTQRQGTPSNSRAFVNSELRIGGWSVNRSYDFRGLIDEVRVYQGSLTTNEVTTIMAERHACPPTTIAEYHFDEFSWSGTAGDVADNSDNGHDATSFNSILTNDISPVVAGNPGTCGYGQFDGIDDYIQLPTSFPDLTGSITITAWIKAADLNSGSRIFIDDQSNSQGYGLSLSDGGAGKLRFYSRAVNPQIVDTQNAVISEDDWYFVAAVHDATNKTVKLYVDGVALPLTTGGTNNTVSTYTGTWGSDAGPASIGGETNSSSETGANFHFNGAIDEPRIYSTALTAAQISTIMSETRTCPVPPTLLLEYRFEENNWDGTADEILDNSGNDHHAQVTNNSAPELSSPALSGAVGTCGYASQNNGSIKTTGLPLDTSTTGVKTTVTFWMNWDGTNSVMPIGWNTHDIWIVSGSIGFNTGNSDVYGVSSAGLANGWHHVAVEFTNGSVTSNRMYIDGVEQVLTQRQGTPINSRAFVNSELRIGGWSVNRSYDFRGLIDEVRVYQGSLTTNEVTTIMAERHACHGLTHFEIQHDGIGLTCEAETLTIKACANANCDTLYDRETSITLAPSGWSGGDTLVFTGALTTSLRITDQSSITFAKVSANPDAGLRCFNGSSETCNMEFVDAGFEFIGATVNDKNLPDQLAETQFSDVQLRSVQNNDGVCQAALTGNQTVTLGYNCDSPDKCLTSLAGIAISNPNGENTGDITLNFSSAGIASLAVLNYADAGRLTLSALANIDGATLLKGTGLVDVYPASLGLNVTPTSLEYTGVVDTTTFTAGEPFEFKIGAFGAAGNLLPNYQPERVQLKVSRTYPVASGTLDGKFRYASAAELVSSAGAISFVDASNLTFTGGEYSYAGAYYDEVGRIAVDVQDLSYLGNKISSQGELPLGHFVPAYYTVEIESPLPALQNVQADFTYVGQRILFSAFPVMKVTAKNALDNTTNNHDSGDWTFRPTLSDVNNALKLSYLDKSAYLGDATVFKGNAPVISGDTNYDGSVFITVPDGTIVYNKTDVNYTMFGPVNPFSALIDIVFHAAFLTDNSGICFRDNYADTSCNDLTFADVTGADLRFGRFALKSTYGPENEVLRPEFAVEYYKDGQWLVNALDNETTINFSQANNQLLLSKKGAGNDLTGSFDPVTSDGKLLLGLPDDKNDFEFSAPGQAGEVYLRLNPAADPNAWPQYLNYDWNGDGKICNQVGLCVNGNGLDYPQAVLSFGLFRGNDRVIQWREVFN